MSVKKIIEDIKKDVSDKRLNANSKDELDVMRAMLNDETYKVGVYDKTGKVGDYCPREDAVAISEKVLSGAGVSPEEAKTLANKYKFGKTEAKAFIGITKEFVNTYTKTGRKLNIGGRDTSDVGIYRKENKQTKTTYPKFIGIGADGKRRTEDGETITPAYSTLKTVGSCPVWLKNKK